MKKQLNIIKSILFPNNKINIFVIIILFLGIISGAIFSNIIDLNNQKLVIEKINVFLTNINTNNLNNILAFKNSLIINFSYSIIIWTLGLTILGILINIFLLYIKGFIFGFSLASFILTYNSKGIILSILYTLFGQLLNILVIMILSTYSIIFTINLIKQITKDKHSISINKFFKNYSIILLLTIIITIISSVSEAFIFPALIKLIIKLFI